MKPRVARVAHLLPALALAALLTCAASCSSASSGPSAPSIVPADAPCVTPAGKTVTLATKGATGLVVDASAVYFTSLDGVHKVPLAGGDDVLLAPMDGPHGLAESGARLFTIAEHATGGPDAQGKVPSGTALYGVTKATGAAELLVEGAFGLTLAGSSDTVYWADAKGVHALPAAGGSETITAPSGVASIEAFGVGARDIFLAVYTLQSNGRGIGSIARLPRAGGAITTIVDDVGHPFAVAVDDDHVYFASDTSTTPIRGEFTVDRVGLDGSGRTSIAAEVTRDLAVDAHALYLAASDSIVRIDKTSHVRTTLATGLDTPAFVRVFGGNVVWINATSVAGSAPNPPYAVMTVCK